MAAQTNTLVSQPHQYFEISAYPEQQSTNRGFGSLNCLRSATAGAPRALTILSLGGHFRKSFKGSIFIGHVDYLPGFVLGSARTDIVLADVGFIRLIVKNLRGLVRAADALPINRFVAERDPGVALQGLYLSRVGRGRGWTSLDRSAETLRKKPANKPANGMVPQGPICPNNNRRNHTGK